MSPIERTSRDTAIGQSQHEAIDRWEFPSEYHEVAADLERIANDPYMGSFTVGARGDEKVVHAFRAHSGPEFNAQGRRMVRKGGLRQVVEYAPEMDTELLSAIRRQTFVTNWELGLDGHEAEVSRLAKIMGHKNAELGYEDEFNGGKGLMVVQTRNRRRDPGRQNPRPEKLSPEEEVEMMQKYYLLMEMRGYNSHEVDVPAGDVGIGADLLDVYAAMHEERHPDDPYKRAVVTGTSVKLGGIASKALTTGFGAYAVHRRLNEVYDGQFRTVGFRAFGAANGWYAVAASADPTMSVRTISDIDATLHTPDSAGFEISPEMVSAVAAEPYNKMRRLMTMIEHAQPGLEIEFLGNDKVYDVKTDVFVPGAMGGDIDMVNAERLWTSGRKLVMEVANEPTTKDGHQALMMAGIKVAPDIVANAQGVGGSNLLVKAHREKGSSGAEDIELTDFTLLNNIMESAQELTDDMLNVAGEIDTDDWRVSALAISQARIMVANGVAVDDRVKKLIGRD